MGEVQRAIDHESDAETRHAEFEAARMIARDSAVSVRLIDFAIYSTRRRGTAGVP